MANKFPNQNLDPGSQAWAREVERAIASLQDDSARSADQTRVTNDNVVSTITQTGVQGLVLAETREQQDRDRENIFAARSEALAAQQTADAAQSTATSAQTTADGKNSITYSTSDPSGSGTRIGDLWWRYAAGIVVGQWRWDGSAWVAMEIDGAVLANLDAGKITVGVLDAARIATGAITADKLSADAIDGKTITGSLIRTAATGDRLQFNSATNAFEAFAGGQSATVRPYENGPEGGIEIASVGTPSRLRVTTAGVVASGGMLVYDGLQVFGVTTLLARLDANYGLTIAGEPYARQRVWTEPRSSNATFPGGSFASLIGLTVANAPPGDYAVDLVLVMSASAAGAGNVRLTGPAGLAPLGDPQADFPAASRFLPYAYTTAIHNFAGGNLTLTAFAQTASGVTGSIRRAGSYLRLMYLGPRN